MRLVGVQTLSRNGVDEMNEVEKNLLTAIQMFLYQVDRKNNVDIHSAEYKTSVEEEAMGVYKLIEDIVKNGEA